jgi:hypothetical protein
MFHFSNRFWDKLHDTEHLVSWSIVMMENSIAGPKNHYDQISEKLKTSRFPLQVDNAINVVKDGHLIICVRYMMDFLL